MGTPKTVVHKYVHEPEHVGRIEFYPDEVRQLAASIVLRAVSDWVDIIIAEDRAARATAKVRLKKDGKPCQKNGRKYLGPNYDEIREFFASDYGDFICGFIDMDADVILERMERWLYAYRTNGVVPKKISAVAFGGR